jgi:hypothetical protein
VLPGKSRPFAGTTVRCACLGLTLSGRGNVVLPRFHGGEDDHIGQLG